MKNIYETFDSANTGKEQEYNVCLSLFATLCCEDYNNFEGRVSQNEILWVFSMAMNGTGSCHLHFSLIQRTFYISVDEKLAWLFKLYDKDSNGEIVQEEMEDIFLKLCRIVEKTEVNAFKKHCHYYYYYYFRCQLHCYCHRPRWTTSRSTPSSPKRNARRRWEYFFIYMEILFHWYGNTFSLIWKYFFIGHF